MHLARKPFAHTRVGPVFVALPAGQQRTRDTVKAWSVHLEITPKRPIEEALRIVPRKSRVFEIEFELTMNVGIVDIAQHAPLFGHLLIEWGSWHRRVEHELVKVGVVSDRVLNLGDHVVWRVMFQANDG